MLAKHIRNENDLKFEGLSAFLPNKLAVTESITLERKLLTTFIPVRSGWINIIATVVIERIILNLVFSTLVEKTRHYKIASDILNGDQFCNTKKLFGYNVNRNHIFRTIVALGGFIIFIVVESGINGESAISSQRSYGYLNGKESMKSNLEHWLKLDKVSYHDNRFNEFSVERQNSYEYDIFPTHAYKQLLFMKKR